MNQEINLQNPPGNPIVPNEPTQPGPTDPTPFSDPNPDPYPVTDPVPDPSPSPDPFPTPPEPIPQFPPDVTF